MKQTSGFELLPDLGVSQSTGAGARSDRAVSAPEHDEN